MPEGVTAEQLVKEFLKEQNDRIFDWYRTEEGRNFLKATNNGQLSFTWQAEYADRTIVRQYDEVTFLRALKDSNYVPPMEAVRSVDTLDKDNVVEFTLYPIAYTAVRCPWYSRSYRIVVRLTLGERFLSYWCVDYRPLSGYTLRRQVIGILNLGGRKNPVSKTLLILSPSGSMTMATKEDLSLEGE